MTTSNKRGAGKGGISVLWRAGGTWPALPGLDRLPVKTTKEQHRRTLRMSLALGRHYAPRPLVAVQYGSRGRLRPPGQPVGFSRSEVGLLCYHSLRRPAAHPQGSP
jgi:hypothetical protein